MHDVLIIGGGVIGLSLAWDLARHGRSVQVLDQQQPGREASWAGAGILPPASLEHAIHPYDQLRSLAIHLHPQWANELRRVTGIDNGYRVCGGIYLGRTPGEAAALAAWAAHQRDENIAVERLKPNQLAEIEPGLATQDQHTFAYYLPQEAQLRNPRHLAALLAACEKAGVEIVSNSAVTHHSISQEQFTEVQTAAGPKRARHYCFTAGAWTGQLLKQLALPIGILPIRGQMVMFKCESPPTTRIINDGPRYLVPRDDGRLLVGSTEEEVGFDKRTTDVALSELADLARLLVPALRDAPIEQTWAGLRPGSYDGLPYLGPLPGLKNGSIATGHFRSGLYLSTATAVVMSQFIRGETPQIDLAPFRVGR